MQKLNCVTSTMCWRIVLLEDKHVSSNAAGHWQQFLHQQHFSVILTVEFSTRFNEIEVGIVLIVPHKPYGLAESGIHAQKTTALTSRCLVATGVYTRSFCEFLSPVYTIQPVVKPV